MTLITLVVGSAQSGSLAIVGLVNALALTADDEVTPAQRLEWEPVLGLEEVIASEAPLISVPHTLTPRLMERVVMAVREALLMDQSSHRRQMLPEESPDVGGLLMPQGGLTSFLRADV